MLAVFGVVVLTFMMLMYALERRVSSARSWRGSREVRQAVTDVRRGGFPQRSIIDVM